jgi:hypothetical protein
MPVSRTSGLLVALVSMHGGVSEMRNYVQDAFYPPTRAEQINRVRRRLAKIQPEDGDMIALVGAMKGILDIVADDGDPE